MLLRLEWIQHLNRSDIYVDELDAEKPRRLPVRHRCRLGPRRFCRLRSSTRGRFETGVPAAGHRRARKTCSADDVRDNLIVRVTDGAGRAVAATTHDGPGQADVLDGPLRFRVPRPGAVGAEPSTPRPPRCLQSNALTSWVLSTLMAVMAIGGVLLTWRAARRERRLSQIRNGFVAGVSHELRTPLTSLAVFGELLRCGRVTAPDRVVEYGRRIEQESSRLRHLVDNVLSFGRIESAEVRYRPEAAAIEDVVGAAVGAVDTRRAQGGFAIAVTAPDAGLPEVRVDAAAMTQVFVNLLDNAMKYSGPCRRVRVELRRRGDEVAVAVADAGIGIAPHEQRRIFDEFYRAAPGSSRGGGDGPRAGDRPARRTGARRADRSREPPRPRCDLHGPVASGRLHGVLPRQVRGPAHPGPPADRSPGLTCSSSRASPYPHSHDRGTGLVVRVSGEGVLIHVITSRLMGGNASRQPDLR